MDGVKPSLDSCSESLYGFSAGPDCGGVAQVAAQGSHQLTVIVDLARLQWLRDEMGRPVERRPWRTKPGIFKQWLRPELYGRLTVKRTWA